MRPIATDGLARSVRRSVCDREPCKSGWTDRDAVRNVDSGGPKEPCVRWDPDPHTWRGNFEGKKWPAQGMPGHVRRSICSKWLSTAEASIPVRQGAHWR